MSNNQLSHLAGPKNRTRPTYPHWSSRVGGALLSRPGAILLVLAGLWAAGLAPVGAFGPAPETTAEPSPQLKGLSASAGRRITTVTIETTDPVAYLTQRPDPKTLVVDLRDVDAARAASVVLGAKGLVAGASVEKATGADGARVARVRIHLTQAAAHQVRTKRNLIYVDFDSAFAADSLGNAVPATPARVATTRYATVLESVRAEPKPTGASVTLVGNGELVAASVTPMSDGTPRIVLDFPNVKSTAPDEIAVGRGPVSVVHVATSGSTSAPATRVTIDLMRPATYRVIPPEDGVRTFTILLEEEVAASAVLPAAGATPNSNTVAALDPINALLSRSAAGPARGTGPLAQAPQGATPQLPSSQGTPLRFTGHPVSLEFESADLRTVLRTFANISGLNIVIDQAVQGAVDVSLHEVPWDQALDIILRDHKLGYSVEGTIVRIAPLAVLADEEGQRRKLAEERALAGELELLTRPLSYAKAAELTPLLTRTALSTRGDIQVDPRTNTIIIRDLASRLQGAAALIDSLDRPQPQVEIEARIIQTTRDYARKLGVQWGFNGRVAPDLGNTTGLAFPNQGSIGGRTGGVQGSGPDATSTAVGLGVNTASSAVGLALGSVNGAFNLDVVLTALEESGNGRILSTPRVATQNNVPAEITQGVQIPIQTVANNTVTVSFRDAALKLNVTPQITAANTVIMSIVLENSSPDFSRAVTGIPPINTQRAVTSLLVSDGQTSVIGGIYINSRDSSNDRVPGVYKIPLLGWLFQRKELTDETRELLIFITPRIIKS